MGGETVGIVYNTFISMLQTVVAAETQINVSGSSSKMTSVFVSLDNACTGERTISYNDFWSDLWFPNAGNAEAALATTHSEERFYHFQLQVGAKLFPEYPITTHAEAFYSLRKSLGVHTNELHSIDIDGNEYRNYKFIVGVGADNF
jgi:hypothetical protein